MKVVRFKTLKDELVTVAIGTAGETAGTVTELTAATNPLVVSEDASDDIFSAVRCKTGVLRVIAEDVQTLQELMAVKPGDRTKKVVVRHGGFMPDGETIGNGGNDAELGEGGGNAELGGVVFSGYVQAAAFSQEFVGFDHEVEIPLSGVLDTLKGVDFPYTSVMSKTYLSLQEMLETIFGTIVDDWSVDSHVDCVGELGQAMTAKFNLFNLLTEKDEDDDYDGRHYTAVSCYDVLEGLCKYFGVCCREAGERIVFWFPDQKRNARIEADVFEAGLDGNSDKQSYVPGKKAVKVESEVNRFEEEVMSVDFNDMEWNGQRYISQKKDYDGKSHRFVSYVKKNPENNIIVDGLHTTSSLFINGYVDETELNITNGCVEQVFNIYDDGDILSADIPESEDFTALVLPVHKSYVLGAFPMCRFLTKLDISTPVGANNFLVLNIGSQIMETYRKEADGDFRIVFPVVIKVGNKYLEYVTDAQGRAVPRWADEAKTVWLDYNNYSDSKVFYRGWINRYYQGFEVNMTAFSMIEKVYGLPENAALYPLPEESITGKLEIILTSPNSVNKDVDMVLIKSFSASFAKRYNIDQKLDKTATKDKNTYTKSLNAGTENYTVTSDWTTAVGIESGKGIVLKADGSNYHDFKNGKCPEEYLLERLAAYWNRSHSVITIGREYDASLDAYIPNKVVEVAGKDYTIAAVESDYANGVQTLTMIEI